MSGGRFDYRQYILTDIIDTLSEAEPYEDADPDEFRVAIDHTIKILRIAYILVHRMDWYLSCDDSWDTYKERLKEELLEVTGALK